MVPSFRRSLLLHAVTCAGVSLVMLFLDVVIPRGATPAIGYCLVPILAARPRNGRFLIVITGVCIVLTWAGLFLEPHGAEPWMSVFDRVMVTGVLGLTALLVWRRVQTITSLQRAKLQLEQANDQLSAFAAVVAHDVRGPLNTISLYNELLSNDDAVRAREESLSCTDSIRKELDAMAHFISRLLHYAQTGTLKLHDCDAQAVLSDVRQGLRAQIEGCGAQITSTALPVVRADRALLANVFQNLIENAMKYRGPDPPRIHVTAEHGRGERGRGEWAFRVRDNGIGIAAQDQHRVFAPFAQVKRGSASDGVGLGLATCKRIVEQHGGRIRVESVPGRGSTFTFTIPGARGATPGDETGKGDGTTVGDETGTITGTGTVSHAAR